MGRQHQQIDKAKEQKAWTAASLRLVVAGYIAYLGYKIAFNPDTTMSQTTARLFGIIFAVAAVGILIYIVYRFRIDIAAAKLPDENEAASEKAEDSGDDGV